MASRKVVLATGEYYHVFNRGVARQPVFLTKRDYERFVLSLSYYRFTNLPGKLSRYLSLSKDIRQDINKSLGKDNNFLVEIVSYVLMPNHFHLLLKQSSDKGITVFMSKLTNSYTRYINTKHERVGDLFQGVFKAVRVETNEQLVHLSRYIHLNPVVSYVIPERELMEYPWSSLRDYLTDKSSFVTTEIVRNQFRTQEDYKQFVLDQIDYGKRLEEISHLALEQ